MTEEEQEKEQLAYEQHLIESGTSTYEVEKYGLNEYKVAKNKNLPIQKQPKIAKK